jgi:solute carrier family 25 carnitine/acylcarnitine transporter 20/29
VPSRFFDGFADFGSSMTNEYSLLSLGTVSIIASLMGLAPGAVGGEFWSSSFDTFSHFCSNRVSIGWQQKGLLISHHALAIGAHQTSKICNGHFDVNVTSSWRHVTTSQITHYLFFIFCHDTGFFSVCVGHPIDLIKVQQQVGSAATSRVSPTVSANMLMGGNSTFGMLRAIFVKEGVPGLYRGVTAPLLAVTPAFAVSFSSFDLASRWIREYSHIGRNEEISITQVALAGGFSGIPLAAIVGPTERIKCLMQVDKGRYSGFTDCLKKVYQEGGLKSVLRGTGATALRDVPGNAFYFGTYEFLKRLTCELEGRNKASTFGTLMAGGCAGVANWVVAIPMDTVKSRWQTAPVGKYKNLPDVFQTLLREGGPRALFRGITPALLRAFPANAACLFGVETVRNLLEER